MGYNIDEIWSTKFSYVYPRTTYIQMDDTLISTVYTRNVTSRVHENFLLRKKKPKSADIYGVGSDHRSVWDFFKFLKSGPPPSLEGPKTPPKVTDL